MVCRTSVPEESRAIAPRTGPQLDENTIADAGSTLRELAEHDLRIRNMVVPTDPRRNRSNWNAVSVG